jgi:hypothetical protein
MSSCFDGEARDHDARQDEDDEGESDRHLGTVSVEPTVELEAHAARASTEALACYDFGHVILMASSS